LKQEGFDKIYNDFDAYLHPRVFETLHKNNLTSDDLKKLYFGSENKFQTNDQIFANLWGDMHFIDGIHKVVNMQVDQGSAPTYLYQFTYGNGFSFIKTNMHVLAKGTNYYLNNL
jgi:carboxylesterase type B